MGGRPVSRWSPGNQEDCVRALLPNESCRLVDYLNDPAPFLALVEGERVALVNKRYVLRVALR